ncbi:hypothetical protein ACIP98_18495 [Streptomyces sp. NPDC088354]|uniref:hypothetical protein n=1 Tax=unclassified Streptomyces TaxID=2593676 RepID=UPI0029B873EB|nr:hypothetical protein [Streptomyces sp. MI02-7b]MDX3072703.1 hypothetical protein [Streptomyces sp. MI02-7b]
MTHTPRDIEATAAALRDEAERLQTQKQGLERELAAVSAHLCSVHKALDALRKLLPPTALDAATIGRPRTGYPSSLVSGYTDLTAVTASVPVPSVSDAEAAEPGVEGDDAHPAVQPGYGRLTEQILQYLATTDGAEVRARDVAAALGRDANAGSINAVRSTLDRLVGASRAQRAGRGLYRAAI